MKTSGAYLDPRVLIAYVAQVAIWGSTWGAIKIGVADVPPWIFAFDRSVLVALSLTAVALAFRLPFPRDRRTLGLIAFSGSINSGICWALIFWAEQFVPSGLVAVFGATAPIWTALLAHFLVRGDRLSGLKVLALALGFGGIVALVGTSGEISGGPALLATVLLALMPLSWAISGIVMSRALRDVSPIPAVAIGTAVGGLFLVPLAATELAKPAAWTIDAIVALLYLSFIGSSVGLVLNFWLYRRLRPTTVMLSQLLITAEAVLIGAVFLDERITVSMLAGAGLVLAAVALNARARREPSPAVPQQAVATPAD
ncbi:MAG: EamA family transporter [Chloroflexi bacterium]|nr:EamA family transporter [Chloroflexota bacterium]